MNEAEVEYAAAAVSVVDLEPLVERFMIFAGDPVGLQRVISLGLATLTCVALADKGFAAYSHSTPWSKSTDMQAPSSVLYVAETDGIFVTNSTGSATKRDGLGWIVKLTTSGVIANPRWAVGLHGPKSLASTPGRLWVLTVGAVVAFDLRSGALIETLEIPAAKELSAIAAADDDTLYVADAVGQSIYRFRPVKASKVPKWHKAERFIKSTALGSPRGLVVRGAELIVAGGSVGTVGGKLVALHLRSKKITEVPGTPIGNLHGVVVAIDDGLYVADERAGRLYRISKVGKQDIVKSDLQSPTGIGIIAQARLLLIPEMSIDRVSAIDLSSAYMK